MQLTVLKKSISPLLAIALSFCLIGSCLGQTDSAYAVTEETEAELTEAQHQIEETARAYDETLAAVEELESQIEEIELKIDKLEKELPLQQLKSDEATIALYKLQQEGYSLMNMILEVDSFGEFMATYEYINQIQKSNMNEINRLNAMKGDMEETKSSLDDKRAQAEEERAKAEEALTNAQKVREEVQKKADEETAAEAAAAAAAVAAAQAQQDALTGGSSAGGSASVPSDVDWSTDKASFVDEWAPRIDAYLAGSPLGGQGRTFAESAWNYGVDPRFSPAISNTESSKGRYCFLPHNAWGWGQISWGSWEEAIDTHVRGLARGYGYTITVAGAQKYCPPNWEHWYNSTLNQMNMI